MSVRPREENQDAHPLECPAWVDDPNVLDRFYDKVFPIPNDAGCLYWDGAKSNGWGLFPITKQDIRGAHRIEWTIANRERIPEGIDIHHECENRWCVNSDHLAPVPHDEHPKHHGEPANTKVTRQDAAGMKMMLKHTNMSQSEIADWHDIHPSQVSRVKRGKRHADVPIPHG